jgi:hypothetical protein
VGEIPTADNPFDTKLSNAGATAWVVSAETVPEPDCTLTAMLSKGSNIDSPIPSRIPARSKAATMIMVCLG